MVKLVRITTENPSAVFQSNLDAGISVSKDASIALQNLTFNAEFEVLEVNSNNNKVKYNLAEGINNTLEFQLPSVNYNNSNYRDFYKDYEGALNGCLSVDQPTPLDGDVYASFQVIEVGDRVLTKFKYTPMIMPLINNDKTVRDYTSQGLFEISYKSPTSQDESILFDDSGTPLSSLNNLRSAQSTNMPTRQNYICPISATDMWCKGSSMFMCRVENLLNHAGADNTHGFGMGLSFTHIARNTHLRAEIQNTSRDFEVLVEKNDAPYRFISPTVPYVEQTSTTQPFKFDISVDTDPFSHDHIIFQRNKNVITACVWNTSDGGGVGVRNELFSYALTPSEASKPLYPYIYLKANATNCMVGRPVLTMDALECFENEDFRRTGLLQTIGGFAQPNAYNAISSYYSGVIPDLLDARFGGYFDLQDPTVSTNGEILRFLGYDENKYASNIEYKLGLPLTEGIDLDTPFLQFTITPEQQHQVVNSDNFIVILDSYALDSYDASRTNYGQNSSNPASIANRGRKLSILATIPKNDNSGFLEYEPNELVYIDLDFSTDVEIKNLNLRILNKEFNPININGKAVMTLLIKS